MARAATHARDCQVVHLRTFGMTGVYGIGTRLPHPSRRRHGAMKMPGPAHTCACGPRAGKTGLQPTQSQLPMTRFKSFTFTMPSRLRSAGQAHEPQDAMTVTRSVELTKPSLLTSPGSLVTLTD